MSSDDPTRPQHNTLETFNLEMAPLERPIEGDVEYEEEPPSRWRQAGAFVGIALFVGLGGALLMARQHSSAAARAEPAQPQQQARAAPAPAAPVVAAAPPAAPAPALAAVAPEAAPAGAAEADADGADAQAAHDASAWRAPPRAAWAKIRTTKTAGQPKHARPATGKVTYRKTTTVRRTVIVKHTVAGRR